MKYVEIQKDGQIKKVPANRIDRFQSEGWKLVPDPSIVKKSPSKPKASAKVTKPKPKMTITKAKAEVVKDNIEDEVFEGDSMQELVDDIQGSQQEE